MMPVADLTPYARNSRTHTADQIGRIALSIREFGFLNPVILWKNEIVAGHARVLAARELGMEQVPCLSADYLTEAQRRAYVIADNKLALDSGWDENILKSEFMALSDMDYNLNLTGFTEDNLGSLISDDAGFAPVLQPTKGSAVVSAQEVADVKNKLVNDFKNRSEQTLIGVTCPHCGQDFSVNPTDLKK